MRACWAGNLKATAQRGNLDVVPSGWRDARSSTLITTPSVSNSKSWRRSRQPSQKATTASMPSQEAQWGSIGRPHARSRSSSALWLARSSATPTAWYIQAPRPRRATSAGSRLRIAPAAALRGFANAGSPASSRSRLIRWNVDRGRYTSPRTSTVPAGASRSASGMGRMVRTLDVTSSPRVPSPRVAPRARRPSTYVNAMLRPSILSSATYLTLATAPSTLRTRSSNARSSASL